MPIAKIQLPDGRIARFEVPEGATEDDVMAAADAHFGPAPEPTRPANLLTDRPQTLAEGMDALKRAAYGVKYGYDKAALGLADLFGQKTPELEAQVADVGRKAEGKPGDFAGNIGDFVGGVLPYLASGPIGGGFIAAATTPGDAEQRAKAAALSTGLGFLGNAVGSALKGFNPSPQARYLMEHGVQPTVGQGIEQGLLGKGVRKAEEATTALPFLGAITRHARDRANNEWYRGSLAAAEVPGVSAAGKEGYDAINALRNGFGAGYDDALAGKDIAIRPELLHDLQTAIGDKSRYLDDTDRQKVADFLAHQFGSVEKKAGNTIAAPDMRNIESNLASKGRRMIGAQDINQAEAGMLFNDLEDVLSNYRSTNMPAGDAARIGELDKGYAAFKRLQRAASSMGAQEGKYSPSQLLSAVKAMDRSKDKARFAEGEALMQNWASAGKNVLGDTLGESGTTPRALMAKLLLGSGEALGAYSTGLPQAGTLGLLMAGGSLRPVQKGLLGGYRFQEPLSNAMRRILQPAGSYYGSTYGNN